MDRAEIMRAGLNKSMVGIEIGPFYSPITPKADGWNTVVIDFQSGDDLRNLAHAHSIKEIRDKAHRIEDVDIVWDGKSLDETCLKLKPEGYDFLIASHVLEHIPDLVSFLQQASKILRENSSLILAMPDLRMTFDRYKPLTNTAALLRAFREKRILQSPEDIFEAFSDNADLKGEGSWLRSNRDLPILRNNIKSAYQDYLKYAEKINNGSQGYIDIHVWKFVPSSFLMCFFDLNVLGLIDFYPDTILDVGEGAEFIAICKKMDLSSLSDNFISEQRTRFAQQITVEMRWPPSL